MSTVEEEFYVAPECTPERREFYERLGRSGVTPLWENLSALVTPEPKSACVPAVWPYKQMRPLLMEAGGLITAREAERRVLALENPGLPKRVQVTQSLYAGLQLILPGEVAPSHRHAASALRFVMEGTGAYTAVDGERVAMQPGDFIITPSWKFHDHGNTGTEAVVWLDGLDVPIVNMFDTSFAEKYPHETQPLVAGDGIASAKYGSGLLPMEYRPEGSSSPLFHYPFVRTRDALEKLHMSGHIDPVHGIKLRYADPGTGGSPMPTIGSYIQKLPSGFEGGRYRSTDATVFCVVEGSGETNVNGTVLQWEKHDVFVVPSWHWHNHVAGRDAILFSFSDRPAQQALGLWRQN